MGHNANHNTAVTIKEIMQQIKKRVAQERKKDFASGRQSDGTATVSLDDIVSKIQSEMCYQHDQTDFRFHSGIGTADVDKDYMSTHNSHGSGSHSVFDRNFTIKDIYSLSDFLALQDDAFLNCAYMAILGRVPDFNGRDHFLSCLRNGNLSKTDILGRLRYSQEGRIRKVPVRGLPVSFFMNCVYKIPLFGYVIKIVTSVLSFPRILKNLQVVESQISGQLARLDCIVARKADRKTVEDIRQVLEQVSVQKADSVRVEEIQDVFTDNIRNITKTIQEHATIILDQQRRLHILLDEAKKCIAESMNNNKLELLASEYDHAHDALYALFEERFRGPREDIRQRLQKYVPLIRQVGAGTHQYPVLDLGCGRGEWLELLTEYGYVARGVDINRAMLQQCHALNLQADESDALVFLKSLPDNSLGALTSFHMIEHLAWRDVVALFDEALRVLRHGGCMIFETPNPENIIVGSCSFYTDPSHLRPIPPSTLEYLAQSRGFVDCEIMRSSPLHFFDTQPQGDMARMMDIFNCGQDYALIAYKRIS
jgi:O-antigen chain-terminating methyltransferase